MNQRRDEQYGRQEFGRHNAELRDEEGSVDLRGSHGREGYGGNWRTEGLAPHLSGYGYANENLANDFSLEGTLPLVSHRGKGPKGFKRTDDRIKELVSEALSDHHGIDASELEVSVKDGEVTLSGTLTERRSKRLAEDIADSVSGVLDVHNAIRIVKLGQDTTARPNMPAPRSQH